MNRREGALRVKVMKFGGTSLATSEARAHSAQRVISARELGFSPVVVVSAIGRKGAPYATDTLIGLLREMDPAVPPDPRELDLMIACGEIFSAVIFAHLLKTLGHRAQAFRGGQAGIRTDGVFGNARIESIKPVALFASLEQGFIPVVCGFQGVYVPNTEAPGGELTTLGRGGSDTTAAALGAAMQAEAVEIFTDVDGVKTADPDYVPSAPTLRTVTYDEVAEIAHLGAKVLHPRAAEIAMKFGIPIWVKNTFSEDPGTQIVPRDQFPGRRVTGVTHTGRLVYLQFDFSRAPSEHRPQLESAVYEMMARYGVNLYMTNLGPAGIGFAVPRAQYPAVEELLDGLVLPANGGDASIYLFQIGQQPSQGAETQAKLLEPLGSVRKIPIELTESCTMVSLVGHEYLQQPGVFLEVLATLQEAQINVLQTSDSEFSLSCLVLEAETERAVRLLHQKFGLSDVR
jgi:aspartate kinase